LFVGLNIQAQATPLEFNLCMSEQPGLVFAAIGLFTETSAASPIFFPTLDSIQAHQRREQI
jgi:hypothetical protein